MCVCERECECELLEGAERSAEARSRRGSRGGGGGCMRAAQQGEGGTMDIVADVP